MRKIIMNNYRALSVIMIMGILLISCNSNNNTRNNNNPISTGLTGSYLSQKTTGNIPELFAPGIVSTKEYNDRDLTISPDGKQLFFARTQTGNNDDYNYDIMHSELIGGKWSDPKIAWFSSKYGEVEAFLPQTEKSYSLTLIDLFQVKARLNIGKHGL